MKKRIICPACQTETMCTKICPKCGNKFNEEWISAATGKPFHIGKLDIEIETVSDRWRSKVKIGTSYNSLVNGIKVILAVPELKCNEDLFAALHEMGHVACKHFEWKRSRGGKIDGCRRSITAEIEAWQYALRCVKQVYKKI